MNNTAWPTVRRKVGVRAARIHDLRHTYGSRLRAAGVTYEDRAALLGHACRSMPELYASPDISRLIGLANRGLERMRTLTILRIANGRKHGVPSDDGRTPVDNSSRKSRASDTRTWFSLPSLLDSGAPGRALERAVVRRHRCAVKSVHPFLPRPLKYA